MAIHHEILGGPGRDNALLVRVDTGKSLTRMLFDCGGGCPDALPLSELLAIDHLLFSHLHMDHVAGFDGFFRAVFNRSAQPNRIWGPPGTAEAFHHRFRSFLWNLHHEMSGTWRVGDVHDDGASVWRYELAEAFAHAYPDDRSARPGIVLDTPDFTVEARLMDHRTPSVAYVVREKSRLNVDPARLTELGLAPGPWLKAVKNAEDPALEVEINGTAHPVAALRERLLTETPGDSIAYLTDFLLDDAAVDRLTPFLDGCDTLVCESQYRHADLALASRNHHMTSVQAARLAERFRAKSLVLFHLSDRYRRDEWLEMLGEAAAIFPAVSFPPAWKIE